MRKKSFMSSLVAVPHMVWCALFIVAPLLFVIYYSFTNTEGSFTLDNLTRLSDYGDTFLLSVEMSIIATFFAFLVGYPFAYFMARQSETGRKICMILLMLPMWTNLLIRTYSMMAILDDGGFLNSVLAWIGLGPVHIVGTKGAVIFGMAYDFFPYMVLPIYTAISKIDNRLMEASFQVRYYFRHHDGVRSFHQHVLHLAETGRRYFRADRRHDRAAVPGSLHLQHRGDDFPRHDDSDPDFGCGHEPLLGVRGLTGKEKRSEISV